MPKTGEKKEKEQQNKDGDEKGQMWLFKTDQGYFESVVASAADVSGQVKQYIKSNSGVSKHYKKGDTVIIWYNGKQQVSAYYTIDNIRKTDSETWNSRIIEFDGQYHRLQLIDFASAIDDVVLVFDLLGTLEKGHAEVTRLDKGHEGEVTANKLNTKDCVGMTVRIVYKMYKHCVVGHNLRFFTNPFFMAGYNSQIYRAYRQIENKQHLHDIVTEMPHSCTYAERNAVEMRAQEKREKTKKEEKKAEAERRGAGEEKKKRKEVGGSKKASGKGREGERRRAEQTHTESEKGKGKQQESLGMVTIDEQAKREIETTAEGAEDLPAVESTEETGMSVEQDVDNGGADSSSKITGEETNEGEEEFIEGGIVSERSEKSNEDGESRATVEEEKETTEPSTQEESPTKENGSECGSPMREEKGSEGQSPTKEVNTSEGESPTKEASISGGESPVKEEMTEGGTEEKTSNIGLDHSAIIDAGILDFTPTKTDRNETNESTNTKDAETYKREVDPETTQETHLVDVSLEVGHDIVTNDYEFPENSHTPQGEGAGDDNTGDDDVELISVTAPPKKKAGRPPKRKPGRPKGKPKPKLAKAKTSDNLIHITNDDEAKTQSTSAETDDHESPQRSGSPVFLMPTNTEESQKSEISSPMLDDVASPPTPTNNSKRKTTELENSNQNDPKSEETDEGESSVFPKRARKSTPAKGGITTLHKGDFAAVRGESKSVWIVKIRRDYTLDKSKSHWKNTLIDVIWLIESREFENRYFLIEDFAEWQAQVPVGSVLKFVDVVRDAGGLWTVMGGVKPLKKLL